MEKKITQQNFDAEVLQAQTPVLVDFWAPWCGPCRMLAPAVEQLAQEAAGRYAVGKVNVDEEPDLAQRFGVMSIPIVLVFKGGQAVQKSVGLVPKQSLQRLLDAAL